MANENERKHDPAENREREMGHRFDDAKTGGDEKNVGQTGTAGGAAEGTSVGSGGAVGGSAGFLDGEPDRQPTAQSGGATEQGQSASGQVLTGEQGGDDNFGGRTGSGSSAMAANNSHADLGAGGPPGSGGIESGGTPGAFVGSEAEDSGDYLQEGRDEPNQGGFAEQGRGAPEDSEGSGPEGSGERKANRDSDIEGSSQR